MNKPAHHYLPPAGGAQPGLRRLLRNRVTGLFLAVFSADHDGGTPPRLVGCQAYYISDPAKATHFTPDLDWIESAVLAEGGWEACEVEHPPRPLSA